MKKLKKTGIQITESDGSALVSGNFHYWDAELSNVVMTDLSEFCPDVIYKPAEHSAGAFTALFYRNSSSGVELCSTSKSLEENKTTIPAKELDKFIACLDRLHQRSEQPNIPSDTRDFIKSLRIPSPWRMKSAWRVSTGFTRHLFVLWGYSSSDSEATILPLTPTSAKWADAGDRVDLHKQLKKSVSKSSLNWGKILKWLLCIFLVLLLIGLVFSLLKYKTLSGSVNVLNNIGSRIVAIFNSPKCPTCHGRLDQNGLCPKLCDECGAHKNKNGECPELCEVCGTHKSNGVCPKTCTIHNKHFVVGKCPRVCPECNRHLDADGKCPELCEKHPNQHKQNGVCPLCNANKPSVGPIAINNKTCPICHGQLDQNGKCPQLCKKCGEHKNNGVCPNICLIHNKHLENGKCPLCQETRSEVTDKTCPICHGPLDRYGKCPQQCKVCGRHKHNGKCPQLCEVCGKHKRNGTCPNVCNTHGNHLQADGTCPRLCPECRRHLNADGKCPEHCGVCGTHKRNGVCPRLCPECHRHLNADGKCPEVCEQHPDQHKWNGVCPLCEIRINKSPTCPICHGQMDQNGKCPQICKECEEHKNNGFCPNLCTIHNKHYVNGNCPMRCPDPGCRRHLDKDGKCPGVCAKHPEQHKRNGLCPVCDSIIQEMDFFIEIKTETQKEGLYYPVFRIKNAIQAKAASIAWKLDGKPSVQQSEFTPQEGFSAGERHEIEAEITYYNDGKQEKYRTQPFVWQKNVDPTIVERHISLIGQHHTDATGDYYILKVCSNPEQSMTIKSWTIEMENYGRIKTRREKQFDAATRLYIADIPAEGKLAVVARIKTIAGKELDVKGAFYYSTSTKTISDNYDGDLTERWATVKHLIEPSIFWCIAENGYGTAFAVSEKDLITNHHVVDDVPQNGKVTIFNRQFKSLQARIVQTDAERDLAWLQLVDDVALQPLAMATAMPRVNDSVGAFGFPYSAVETDKSKLPDMYSSYGVVTQILPSRVLIHDADIYSGNSGGPLIDLNGCVVGVNTLVRFKTENGEMTDKSNAASPVQFIIDAFPRLRQKLAF